VAAGRVPELAVSPTTFMLRRVAILVAHRIG
jgi:hypothetical protein